MRKSSILHGTTVVSVLQGVNNQAVEVGDGRDHVFQFKADRSAPLDANGLPGLRIKATKWCTRQAKDLTVEVDDCASTVVQQTIEQVAKIRARSAPLPMDPAHGLAPGLLAYQAGGGPSCFHNDEEGRQHSHTYSETIVRLAWSPSIVYLPKFVDESTCAEMIRLATPSLKPSRAKDAPLTYRTSATATLNRSDEFGNPLVSKLMDRVHNLMNVPPDHGEPLQIARYRSGEVFNLHPDSFRGEPRSYTFLAYLNTPEGGGHTIFPRLRANGSHVADPSFMEDRATDEGFFAELCRGSFGDDFMRIVPHQGDAILFTPMRPWMQTDDRAIHGACPVTGGEKWVLQRWARAIYDPKYEPSWRMWRSSQAAADRLSRTSGVRHHDL